MKTRCQLWHVHFKTFFLCGCPPKKIGASYGIEISKPLFLFGDRPKQMCQLWHGTCLVFIGGLPKINCQLWHGTFPKKYASYNMEYPLFIFIWGLPQKSVPVMAWKPISLFLFRDGPIHLFLFNVFPTTKHTPAHLPIFSKNHSWSCPSSWRKTMPFLAG